MHVFAFGRRALVRLLSGTGFDVVRVVNSSMTGAPAGRRGRVLARSVGLVSAVLAAVSRGRWLLGPSLEVYARRRP